MRYVLLALLAGCGGGDPEDYTSDPSAVAFCIGPVPVATTGQQIDRPACVDAQEN